MVIEAVIITVLLVTRHPAAPPESTVPRPPLVSTNSSEPFYAGQPGPWGELVFAHIDIEPPDDFVQVDDRTFEPTRWFFAGGTRAKVVELFAQCDLTPEQHVELT